MIKRLWDLLVTILALPVLMVAAPQYATMTFLGRRGRTFSKDCYLSDVANALINWDAGAGASATSPANFRTSQWCRLIDFAIVTGMTDTTKIQLVVNGQPTGDFLRYSIHLTTLSTRAPLNIGWIPPNAELVAIQR